MSKKRHTPYNRVDNKGGSSITTHRPQSAKELSQVSNDLKERGFIPMGMPITGDVPMGGDTISSRAGGALSAGDILTSRAFAFEDVNSRAVPVAHCGTPGLGFIPWGPQNNLPVLLQGWAAALPYTAAPLRYLADLTAGLGPKLMYRHSRVVNGKLETEYIPFEDAGILLEEEGRAEDLAAWRATLPEAKAFCEENNLTEHLLGCMQDDVHMDIYFPTFGLTRGRLGTWTPKIVSLGQLSCSTTRLEQMNKNRHINYVYYCQRWRRGSQVDPTLPYDITAYPAVMPQHLLRELRKLVELHEHDLIKDRPTWICCPTFYPSGLRAYYPQPAWWSIYPSDAFRYVSTVFYDKVKARENKTMFGKVMYINMNYLNTLFAQRGAKTTEEQEAVRREIYESVNRFLQRRENHGKLMVMDSWIEAEKLWKAVELVDVTESTNDQESASEKELEGAANVIFLALGVDPRLVGVALSGSSNGGTFQRELSLLKQQQLASKQHLYLNFLNVVPKFNGWDPHAEFVIQQQVLTTLDRSKTGLEATTSQSE